MRVTYQTCCGVDVHKSFLVATIIKTSGGIEPSYQKQRFSTFNNSILKFKQWLLENDCHDVCMESTGKYWIPVFNLLEDVIIENKQAMEMCSIYRDITSSTMDAFASIISNNLNNVMKLLTSLTVVLTVPTLIASIWGMNVPVPFQSSPLGFVWVMVIMLVVSFVAFLVLWRKKMF